MTNTEEQQLKDNIDKFCNHPVMIVVRVILGILVIQHLLIPGIVDIHCGLRPNLTYCRNRV